MAIRWITEHSDRFRDGQVHADPGAFGPTGPTDTETVLRRLLRAFGVEADAVPPDFAGQAALYRSVTAGRAVAVLADDADTAAQVRPLLPASPVSVVSPAGFTPDSPEVDRLRDQLHGAADHDPEFAARLRETWEASRSTTGPERAASITTPPARSAATSSGPGTSTATSGSELSRPVGS